MKWVAILKRCLVDGHEVKFERLRKNMQDDCLELVNNFLKPFTI